MIYFLQEKGNPYAPVKIGYTDSDVTQRLLGAQHGYPFGELAIIGVGDGGEPQESDEHSRWQHLAMRGEWFAPNRELLDHIRALNESFSEKVKKDFRDMTASWRTGT